MLITSCVESEKERDENLKRIPAAGALRTACLAATLHPPSHALSFTSCSGKDRMLFHASEVQKCGSTAPLSRGALLLPSPAVQGPRSVQLLAPRSIILGEQALQQRAHELALH